MKKQEILELLQNEPVEEKICNVKYNHTLPDYVNTLNSIIEYSKNQDNNLSTLIQNSFEFLDSIFINLGQNNKIALSYNGGKDATVVLFLILAYLLNKVIQENSNLSSTEINLRVHQMYKEKIKCFFFHTAPEFEQIITLILYFNQLFDLNIQIVQNYQFKKALQKYIEINGDCTHCLVGLRSTDPHAQDQLQLPSPGWPQITRISPIHFYTFIDVFEFLIRFKIQYCELYNQGYTSIGSSNTTEKNASLHKSNQSGTQQQILVIDELIQRGLTIEQQKFDHESDYLPAIMLPVSESEGDRVGRL